MSRMNYDQVYIKYRTKIEQFLRYQYGCSEQDAQDITAEAFIVLYNKWDAIGNTDEKRICTFLFRTAKNKSLEHYARQKDNPLPHSLENISDQIASDSFTYIDPQVEDRKYLEYIEQIRRKLDATEVLILESFLLEKLTPAQVARKMGMSENGVRVRWCRIRKKVQKLLPEIFGR